MNDWGVWCEVWGGVTGRRETWLKSLGELWTGSEAEARERAAKLNMEANGPYAKASFRYTPRRLA